VNPKFYRPVENGHLLGSAAKAKKVLGWEPKYTLESLVEEMVLSDIELVKNGRIFSNTYLDWLVDKSDCTIDSGIGESENTKDSGITNGKGSVAQDCNDSDSTVDSGIGESENTEDSHITNGKGSVSQDHNGLEHVVEGKPLSSAELNGHILSLPPFLS